MRIHNVTGFTPVETLSVLPELLSPEEIPVFIRFMQTGVEVAPGIPEDPEYWKEVELEYENQLSPTWT